MGQLDAQSPSDQNDWRVLSLGFQKTFKQAKDFSQKHIIQEASYKIPGAES